MIIVVLMNLCHLLPHTAVPGEWEVEGRRQGRCSLTWIGASESGWTLLSYGVWRYGYATMTHYNNHERMVRRIVILIFLRNRKDDPSFDKVHSCLFNVLVPICIVRYAFLNSYFNHRQPPRPRNKISMFTTGGSAVYHKNQKHRPRLCLTCGRWSGVIT